MKENLIFSILTILISIFFLIVSLLNPVRSSSYIGPNAWPNVVLIFTITMGILQLFKAIREGKSNREKESKEVDQADDKHKPDQLTAIKHWILLGELALYILLLPYLGFLVATLILMPVLFRFFGMKKRMMNFIGTIASNITFIFVFANLLNITLPRGIGIFQKLSFIFY